MTTSGTIAAPKLWSPENPALYTLRTSVVLPNGKTVVVDEKEIICVALMLWRVDIVAAVPFVFAALPLVKCLVHHEEAHLVTNDANKPEEERRFRSDRPNMERLTVISKKLAPCVWDGQPPHSPR